MYRYSNIFKSLFFSLFFVLTVFGFQTKCTSNSSNDATTFKILFCSATSDFYRCSEDKLKETSTGSSYQERLEYSCGTFKELKNDLRNINNEAKKSLSDQEYSDYLSVSKNIEEKIKEEDYENCKRKKDKEKARSCYQNLIQDILKDSGCPTLQ